jgi:hypothetical protein
VIGEMSVVSLEPINLKYCSTDNRPLADYPLLTTHYSLLTILSPSPILLLTTAQFDIATTVSAILPLETCPKWRNLQPEILN